MLLLAESRDIEGGGGGYTLICRIGQEPYINESTLRCFGGEAKTSLLASNFIPRGHEIWA